MKAVRFFCSVLLGDTGFFHLRLTKALYSHCFIGVEKLRQIIEAHKDNLPIVKEAVKILTALGKKYGVDRIGANEVWIPHDNVRVEVPS